MTLIGFAGVVSALAFVLGLLFVALRLVRDLPAFGRGALEGPELKVLGRAGLTPKQGVATVRVGEQTLVVGYGEGGVRYLADATPDPVSTEVVDPPAGTTADTDDAVSDSTELPTTAPSWAAGIPFPKALNRAMRQAGLFLLTLLALGALSATDVSSVGAGALWAQQQEAVTQPQVAGPTSPTTAVVPRADFPAIDVTMGEGDDALRLSGPVGTVIFVGFLTLLPTLLLLMTSFTRILVVLHLLKQAIGTQTAPPAHLLAAMALLLTGFVMAPTLSEANRTGVQPWVRGEIDEMQMLDSAAVPFRAFMLSQVRESDVETFLEMGQQAPPDSAEEVPYVVLSSAFVVSELRAAFQMGFALFLPFVIIDVVVASVLMSMGMFMLPPVMISLPFKLLLFVMVDGWALIVGSLVRSFG